MSVLIDFSIFPIGKNESVSPYVSRAVNIIENSGLAYKLGPMGTAVEGEWEELMAMVTRCFNDLKKDCPRIYMNLKVDYRQGGTDRIEEKVESVTRK
jgi:uncharacterized protein (TIGR00106 family)